MTGSAKYLIKLNDSKVSFIAFVEGSALHHLNRAGRICSPGEKEKNICSKSCLWRSTLGCEGLISECVCGDRSVCEGESKTAVGSIYITP